ncbi:MAG: MTAP family purine nucleoside phosphorylase [Dermatophilaceae bacterium]
MTPLPLGIIAGTGFDDLEPLQRRRDDTVDTAYGPVHVTRGDWHGLPVVFLPRHGVGHTVPPHLIDHRSNIRALADLGVRDIVGINVVGGIDPGLRPGDLLCLDDFIDLTGGSPITFHDGTGPAGVVHTDMVEPYDAGLRREVLDAADSAGRPMRDGGVYACFAGPRFESRAEIRLARLAGADVAGMTGAAEVVLAAEAGLRYAAVSLVVNPASGVGTGTPVSAAVQVGTAAPVTTAERVGTAAPISMAAIETVLMASRGHVLAVLDDLVRRRALPAGSVARDAAPLPAEPAR